MTTQAKQSHRSGFTLMEMMLVLAILVVLMGFVAPGILGSQKKADINSAKTQIGLFKGSLMGYALDCKTFPTTEQGLKALLGKPGETEGASSWDGPYVEDEEIPKDPWKQSFKYRYPPEERTNDFPEIWSIGPDGEDGTADDITNWKKRGGDSPDGMEIDEMDMEDVDAGLAPN